MATRLNDLFRINATSIVHEVIRDAFVASKLQNYTDAINELDQPPAWQTWGVGIAIISGCSFSAPLGILLLPCFTKTIYERIMTFLVALGIGALSGSTIFIMLPQAFHLNELNDFDYHSKSMIILTAIYVFFTVDRILQYVLELRRRHSAKRKIHSKTIASIINSPQVERRPTTGNNGSSSNGNVEKPAPNIDNCNDLEKQEISELADELDAALANNILARTFSTRRRIAVMTGVDDIEFRKASGQNNNVRDPNLINAVNLELKRRATEQNSPLQQTDELPPKDDNDEVAVTVKVVEKRVIEPAAMEVASVAYMIIFGSSANNFVDGMSMGAAFSDNLLRGLSIGIAVISQQFPQELGVLAILIKSGLGLKRTLLFNMVPIILSYLGFGVGVLLDSVDDTYDQYIFAVSSGMYMYIFLGTLIPEIRDSTNELIKENLVESMIVTALQFCGIAFGTSFMFYMSGVGDVELA
ncbi:unnamed protein product [Caenorhabditis auriculariae]|uniref:Uncharacterized protein n=1 Tax=Caenorhabditis auriculariae TaxID=2777116 RepID=A0A8S1GWD6_9PELO|nr:unnamed protein product [Caenorhabditis auriculariae]